MAGDVLRRPSWLGTQPPAGGKTTMFQRCGRGHGNRVWTPRAASDNGRCADPVPQTLLMFPVACPRVAQQIALASSNPIGSDAARRIRHQAVGRTSCPATARSPVCA